MNGTWDAQLRKRHPIHPSSTKKKARVAPRQPLPSSTVLYRPLPSSTVLYRPLPSSTVLCRLVLGDRHRIHTHPLPRLVLVLELHDPVDHCEQAVVRRPPHVAPRMELRAALLDEDAPCRHELPRKPLDAQVFRA